MMRRFGLAVLLIMGAAWMVLAAEPLSVYVQTSEGIVQVSLDTFPRIEGTVAYEGPTMDDGTPNWKDPHTYEGVSLQAILQSVGGLGDANTLGVVAVDGWYKQLPARVLEGDTVAGIPILALSRDGQSGDDWEDAPVLIFLPEDEAFSNDDMLAAIGPDFAHYYGDKPSTTGMMVKGVQYLVPDYNGEELPLQPEAVSLEDVTVPEDATLTVVRGDDSFTYTLSDIEEFETLTGEGTFTNSNNVDYTAVYTGVPMTTLIGNVSGDSTILVTASDGYSMTYPASMFQDTSEGTWILAYKENGAYMPMDPGYFRIVEIGDDNPHFSSSLSARMVATIEVQGTYEEYSLHMVGAVERIFSRGELESGVGCPCHTSTVTVTSKGETDEYTGLPLWRLLAYVDDDVYPSPDQGIFYNDGDFNDQLAAEDYTIELVASDGYTQTVTSDLVAHDDRFIIAFKKNGAFLDPASDGYMRFVFDDSVSLPDDMKLRSVKFLTDILLDL
jgi:hypothetical protein